MSVIDNGTVCRSAMNRQLTALMLILMLLLPGCLQSADVEPDDDVEEEIVEEVLPTIVALEQTDGCDNLNPLHCMLPFPSDAFLIEDNSTVTGLRVNYAESTLPESGSMSNSGDYNNLEKACAINFREAINTTKVKHLIYLSGIVNEAKLSKHLGSRKNVEIELKKGKYNFGLVISLFLEDIDLMSVTFKIFFDGSSGSVGARLFESCQLYQRDPNQVLK